MTAGTDSLVGSLRRFHNDVKAGRQPADEDITAAGRALCRADGCSCDPTALNIWMSWPSAGDRRPILHMYGHGPTCPLNPGPGRPPGLRLVA